MPEWICRVCLQIYHSAVSEQAKHICPVDKRTGDRINTGMSIMKYLEDMILEHGSSWRGYTEG